MAVYNPPKITPFDNGMILVSMRNELLSASQVGFTVGARNDPTDFRGMAHVNEHDFCRGASKLAMHAAIRRFPGRPVPVSERQANRCYRRFFGGSNGPGINVYTLTSHTGYGHQDLFAPRYLGSVFPVMAGMIRDGMYDVRDVPNRNDAIVSPKAFEVERSAVDNETAENDEFAAMDGYRAGLKALYVLNPARNHGDSDPEQLAQVKLGTVKQWARGHYVPANMRVIILGPSKNKAVRLVREAKLNEIPAWTPDKWHYDRSDDLPVLDSVKHVELTRVGTKMRHVSIFWPTDPYGCAFALALQVLVGLIKDRIEDELREENTVFPGGVYHPFVDWDCTSSHGFFTVQFSTRGSDAHCDDLVRRVLDRMEEVKTDRSTEFAEDVDDGRFFLANSYLEEYHFTPGAFADRMMAALANGDPKLERFNAYYNDMLHVSPTRVRNAAIKYLHRDRLVLTVVRPAP